MQRSDDLRTLADRRSDAFHRVGAHIADGEDATLRGLQIMAPAPGIAASENEALCVECDARTSKPVRVRVRTDEEEQMIDRTAYFLVGADLPAHGFQRAVAALKPTDGCACHYLDIGKTADAFDQVAGHRCPQVGSAHQHPDLNALARQINGGLAGGVAGADQRNFLIAAQLRFHWRRPVVNARCLEGVELLAFESPISRSGCEYHRARPHPLTDLQI